MRNHFTGLWQHSDFMKLWIGQSISSFGSKISREALPLTAVLVLAASPTELGLLAALAVAPILMIGLVAGVWVDRVRCRPLMIASDLGRAVLLGSIPVAAVFGALSMSQLYVVAILVGTLTVFFDLADQSYLPSLIERENLLEGNSKLGASAAVAEIGGPALGGILVQLITAPFAIMLDALSFLASALCLGLIRKAEPRPTPPEGTQSMAREAFEGVRVVVNQPILRAIALSNGQSSFFGSFFAALYTLYAIRELKLSAGILGILIGIGGISALAGALLAEKITQRFGPGRTLIGALLFNCGMNFLIPLAQVGGPLLVAIAFLGVAQLGDIGGTIYAINERSLRQTIIPDQQLGRANAAMHVWAGGMALLGALVGGLLGGLMGMQLTLLVAASGGLLSILWLLFSPIRRL